MLVSSGGYTKKILVFMFLTIIPCILCGADFDIVVGSSANGSVKGKIIYVPTLEAALATERSIHRLNGKDQHVNIGISEKYLKLYSTLELSSEDSHTSWIGTGGSPVIIDCSLAIQNWKSEMNEYVTKLPIKNFTNSILFTNGNAIYKTRYPVEKELKLAMPSNINTISNGSPTIVLTKEKLPLESSQWNKDVEVNFAQAWMNPKLRLVSCKDRTSIELSNPSQWRPFYPRGPQSTAIWFENIPMDNIPGYYIANDELHYSEDQNPKFDPAYSSLSNLDCAIKMYGSSSADELIDCNFQNISITGCDVRWNNLMTNAQQAAATISSTMDLYCCADCHIEACNFRHNCGWGIGLQNCRRISINRCNFFKLGAGAIKVDSDLKSGKSDRIIITENKVDSYGWKFANACGILIKTASNCFVDYNSVQNGNYTGISIGWTWGYGPSNTEHNDISYNKIMHVGKGMLSDLGGIYTLGIQPGSVIHGNTIADIKCRDYGGWGIYLDEGSSKICVSNNVVFHTSSGGFHQHYGEDNLVTNNVFAYGETAQIKRSVPEQHTSFIFQHNIIIWKSGDPISGIWVDGNYLCNSNIWYCDSERPTFAHLPFVLWQAMTHDQDSLFIDPQIKFNDDFTVEYQNLPILNKIHFSPIGTH